jgi:hypothetical protein
VIRREVSRNQLGIYDRYCSYFGPTDYLREGLVRYLLYLDLLFSRAGGPNDSVKNPSTYPHNEHRVVWATVGLDLQ